MALDSPTETTTKETIRQVLSETLDYLMAVVRNGVGPDAARSGLRPLQARFSDVAMELIWDEEAMARSTHYDALLHLPERGTISLSYCDDQALPWPLRGVHRFSDADLFSVVRRREVPAAIGQTLFGSPPGSVLAPVREDGGYAIIRVLSIVPAGLDEPTRNMIKHILFDEWLELHRRVARIDWLWGNLKENAEGVRSDASLNVSPG